MKNPCKDCLVLPACSVECKEYYKFSNFLINVVSPIIVLTSVVVCGAFMSFLIMSHYNTAMWIYLAITWLGWIFIEDGTGFFDTLMAPFFLPASLGMRFFKLRFKRKRA